MNGRHRARLRDIVIAPAQNSAYGSTAAEPFIVRIRSYVVKRLTVAACVVVLAAALVSLASHLGTALRAVRRRTPYCRAPSKPETSTSTTMGGFERFFLKLYGMDFPDDALRKVYCANTLLMISGISLGEFKELWQYR